MATKEFIKKLFCDTGAGSDLGNLTSLETFGGFGFDLTESDFPSDLRANTSDDYDFLCMNGTDWDRDALLGNDAFRKIMDDLNVYLTPVIILLGMAGNLVAFCVFTTTHLKRQSSSVYLASLAVVDMLFLMCLSVIWLSWIRVNIFHRNVWCQCVVYLSYVCTFLSVWYVVSFTIERYIIVHYPLRKDRYCTRKRAKRVVCSLAVLAVGLYSFSAVTNGSVAVGNTLPVCTPLTRYYTIITIATASDFFCTLLVPSIVIIIMNVRIVVRIMGYSKQRVEVEVSETLKSNSSDGKYAPAVIEEMSDSNALCTFRGYRGRNKTVTYIPRSHSTNPRGSTQRSMTTRRSINQMQHIRIAHGRTRAQYRTARMLIIVSSVFVILNSPNHIFRIHAFLRSSLDDRYMTDLMALKWHELFQLLYHLNFSINFFLYSACGRQFRTGLCILGARFVHKMHSIKEYMDNVKLCRFVASLRRKSNCSRPEKSSNDDIPLPQSCQAKDTVLPT